MIFSGLASCAPLLAALLSQAVVEEFTPSPTVQEFEPAPPAPSVKPFGSVVGQLGVDTRFESTVGDPMAENVGEFLSRATLGADVKISESVRLYLEGKGRWWGATQRGWKRAKGSFEPSVGEAFVDLYAKVVDLRVGNQVVAFGANPAFAPSDQLNPRDLRDSFLLGEPEDSKLPAFAARLRASAGPVDVSLAFFPFFAPNRYTLFGQDTSLLQPGLGATLPGEVDESIEDSLQEHLGETERPKAFPHQGDVGVRVTGDLGRLKLGASYVNMHEKMPTTWVDPELAALLEASAAGQQPDPAVALSVQQRFLAKERLLTGKYSRQQVLSAEAAVLVGPAEVDVDFGYVPEQGFFDEHFQPVRKSSFTWVVGVTQAEDSPWVYNLTYVGVAVPKVRADELLFLFEPGTAGGDARTAYFHTFMGNVSRRFWEDRLEVGARGAFEPIQRSWAAGPSVSYKPVERLTLTVAAEFFEGKAYSPFGYFGRNDQVLFRTRVDLF